MLCTLLAALIIVPVARAGAPDRFYGVVPQTPPSDGELQMMQAGGVGSLRVLINWARVQPTRGAPFEWKHTDRLIGDAARQNIQLAPMLLGTPQWATGCVRRQDYCERIPPVGTKAVERGWRKFVTAAVKRYGSGGEFWSQPSNDFAPLPVTTWQVWNEQNLPTYWEPRPSVKAYAKLLDHTAGTVRGADSQAKIVLGGMNGDGGSSKHAMTAWDYLGKLYGVPGARGDFNDAAIHPYDATATGAIDEVKRLHEVLVHHHDRGAGLWITEIGWSSDGGNSTVSTGLVGQAKQLRNAFSTLTAERTQWNLQRVFWYAWRDRAGAVCDWCGSSGLMDRNLAPKPAWLVYESFSIGLPIPNGLFG